MLKNGRIYIYILITFLTVFYNFLYEIEENTMDEAVFETIILFPCILLFIILIYYSRTLIFSNKIIVNYLKKPNYYKLVLMGVIIFKSIGISLIARSIANYAFNDDNDPTFFDLIFWAILMGTLVITSFVYFFEHFISTTEKNHYAALELSKHEKEKVISKYLSLKKQLNPHFLFNSFNSLISLIPNDTKKAEDFVEELSSIYRYNLIQSDEIVVPLSKELDMIESYIYLQKIRFGKALIYKENIDLLTKFMLLPPMTLQLLVENAIKHNKASLKTPLIVEVYTTQNFVIVKNNLQLKDKSNYHLDSLGIGLKNLENQIKLITDTALVIEKNKDSYIVYVPLIKGELDD